MELDSDGNIGVLAVAVKDVGPKKVVTKEEVEVILKDGDSMAVRVLGNEYMYSMYFRGNNTAEDAAKPAYRGAMDARELYPTRNLKVVSVEEFTRQLYAVKRM